jgi:putative transposase
MPIGDDTACWRGNLPHLQQIDRAYFVTFVTRSRAILSAPARDIVLATIVAGHLRSYDLYVARVMPDHVHLITTIYESTTLPAAIKFMKSVSARRIGAPTWQDEYFDRIMRKEEDLRQKADYILDNPVRAGLVTTVDEYPWKWRRWVEGAVETAR